MCNLSLYQNNSNMPNITAEDFEATMNGTDEEVVPETPLEETPPPAGNEPPADTNEPPAQAAAPVFNFDEELVKITNGAIKSKDEIAALLEAKGKTSELETQLKTFQDENSSLKTKAEADPFANDFTKKLNELYKSGASDTQISGFMAIQKVEVDKLSPMEASSLALQIKHGLTPSEAKTYLNDKYGVDVEDPEAKLSPTQEIALKVDSSADRAYLNSHKAEVSAVPEDKSVQQQKLQEEQYNQRITQLEPIAKNVVSDVLTNSFKGISINGKDGEASINVDLPISEESKASLSKVVADMVSSNWNGLTADTKGQEAIKTFADNVLVLQNWKNWAIDIASKREMQVRAEYNNPTSINRGDAAPAAGKTVNQEKVDGLMETLELY